MFPECIFFHGFEVAVGSTTLAWFNFVKKARASVVRGWHSRGATVVELTKGLHNIGNSFGASISICRCRTMILDGQVSSHIFG